jgi:hypothetical protein
MWPLLNPDVDWRNEALHFQPYQLDAALTQHFATLAAGGWGSGKTTAGLGFLATSAMMSPPNTAGMAIQPTFDLMNIWLEQVLIPAFRNIIKYHDRGNKKIHLPGNRILYYRTGHIPERLQLSNLTYLFLDEPHLMKRKIFENAVARARKMKGRLRILLTSLPKIGWLSENFDGNDDPDYRCMHMSTYENKHLPKKYISRLEAACPKHMHPAYLGGQFVPAGGSVYSMFEEDRHVIPWEFRRRVRLVDGYEVEVPINYAIDWGRRRPHVLWMQRVPRGTLMPGGWATRRETTICADEIYPDGRYGALTVQRLCIKARDRKPVGDPLPYAAREAISDPAGRAEQSTSALSEVTIAHRDRVKVGVEHVHLALDPFVGEPYLFFAKSLKSNPDPCAGFGTPEKNRQRAVINAMQGYSYPEKGGDELPDEPHHDDVFSHAVDCVRYHIRHYYPTDRLSADVWSAA